jgi:hypothetical protein
MLRIAKTLPGELAGDVDPEDYGFEVIREEPPDKQDSARRVARLYTQIFERTGMVIPPLERYLEEAGEPSPSADVDESAVTGDGEDQRDDPDV